MSKQPDRTKTLIVNRRTFLRLSAVAAAGAGMAACGGAPPPAVITQPTTDTGAVTAAPTAARAIPTPVPQAAAPTAAVAGGFKEAPMLAQLVEQGKLPPLAERLPKNPVVLDGIDGVGKYGGVIRRAFKGVGDRFGPIKILNESLFWYNSDLSIRPNLAEAWESNDDATEWTFTLREGTKWSDGSDFTTENFIWWQEHVLQNEALQKIFASDIANHWSTANPRTLMQMEAIDEYTIKLTFAKPKPLLIYSLTRFLPAAPGHYMGQFHADLAKDTAALEAAAKQAGWDAWDRYYEEQNHWYNPGRPILGPWMATSKLSDELYVMERNPYFWQVDSTGQQLPYVDKITHLFFEASDAFNTRIVAGEIDFQARHVGVGDFTLFKENEARGDYRVMLGVSANHVAFQPNQAAKNERVRAFFQERKVRIALSHAINRDEINELIYAGQATPRQYSPLRASPQYYEKLTNAYIEYNPTEANRLLDEAGYAEKDAESFRLWKDGSGETLSFVIEGIAPAGSVGEDEVQTVIKYFADVGVKASYKALERSLYIERHEANEVEAAFWGGDRSLLPIIAPWIFLGSQEDRPWAGAWGIYYNDPTDPNAEEPPVDHYIRKIWDMYAQMSAEPDEEQRNALFRQILDIWAEELPMIGILGELPSPTIVKNGLQNFREGFPNDDTTEDENFLNTQTYYWDEPGKHGG